MRKITFSIMFSFCCLFGFAQTFPGTGTPVDTQNGQTGTDATCGTAFELTLTVDVTGVGILGATNILDQVDIDITHTWSGDVTVELIAPDGTTTAVMTSGNGGGGDNYTGTQFRDDAATSITAGSAPFTGAFQPQEALATFNGVDADGTWTLFFCDSANGDVGTFNSWALSFAPAPLCGDPSGVTAVGSGDSAEFSWIAGAGTPVGYNWEIQPSGVAQGTPGALASGTEATTSASSGMVLTASTDYEFYVQQDCGGDGTSAYVQLSFNSGIPNNTPAGAIPITPSPEGTGCATATFTLPFSTDGTTDSGIQGSCSDSGLDQFFTWTATTDGLTFNSSAPGNPGIVVWDANTLAEIDCANTFATDAILGGWTIGQDLVIQIYDFAGSTSDVAFCLEEFTFPTAPDCAETPITPADGAIDVVVTAGEVTLTWTAPSGGVPPTDYRIFFGDTSGALNDLGLLGGTGTTVDITGIAFSTEYFWQIVPENGGSPAVGCPEWSFTTEAAPPPPANNDCANATMLTPGNIFTDNPVVGTNLSATGSGELPDPSCSSYDPADPSGFGGDVWYMVTVPNDGNLTIETNANPTGAGGDSGMSVYSGACGSLVEVDCDDDGSADGLYSLVDISDPALANQVVYIRVFEFGGDSQLDFQISAYSATLGVSDLNNPSAFSYYPNPVENTLTLNAASNNIDNIVMFNMLGQQVLNLQPNALTSDVDMSGLQTGTYFVQVTVANETKTIRVLKQ